MLESLKHDIIERQQAKEFSILEESLVMMAVRESFIAGDNDISDDDLDRLLEEIPEDDSEDEVSPNPLNNYGDLLDDEGVEEAVSEGTAIDDTTVKAPGKMDSDPAAKKAEMEPDTDQAPLDLKAHAVKEGAAIDDTTVKAPGKMDSDPAAKKAEMTDDNEQAPLDLKAVKEGAAIDDVSVKAPGKSDSDPAAKKAEMEPDTDQAPLDLKAHAVKESNVADEELQKRLKAKGVCEGSAIDDVTVKAPGKMDSDPAAKKAEMTDDNEQAPLDLKTPSLYCKKCGKLKLQCNCGCKGTEESVSVLESLLAALE